MTKKTHALIGKTVGEYEVLSRIGQGGMGEVFEGRHPIIGKRVAIKTLLPQLSQDESLVQRFIAEARAVNAIRHRGIVDIFGFGRLDDETQYFVMEFLDGMAFDKIIGAQAPMAAADVLELLDQVIDALGAAHTAGVIHRDIKPSNLYLVDTGQGEPYVKVLDFGIAKTDAINGKATPQTRASMVMGTPDYMSPEQLRGEPVGAPSDFYALGCVAYEMLVGRSPYKGENAMATMFAHVEQPVRSPRDANSGVPESLDEVVTWMMQKHEADRPANARELLARLDALWPELKGMARPPRRTTGDSLKRLSSGKMAPVPVVAASATPTRAAPQTGSETRKQRTPHSLAPLSLAERPEGVERREGPRGAGVKIEQFAAPSDTSRVPAVVVGAPEPKSRLPLFLAVGALSLGATVGALWLISRPQERPPPPTVAPLEPEPEPAPVAVAEPAPAPEPVVEAPAPAPVVEKPAPKPAKAGLTQAVLEARVRKLAAQLDQKEKAAGGEDRVLRQFLTQVRASVAKANDDASRRKALSEINELAGQLQ